MNDGHRFCWNCKIESVLCEKAVLFGEIKLYFEIEINNINK